MARRPKPAPAEDWDNAETEGETAAHDTEDNIEDQDEGEGGDAPDEDAEADFAAMSEVDHDAPPTQVFEQPDRTAGGGNTEGLALGTIATPRQNVGLDPMAPAQHIEEAQRRADLTNAQTTHEADNALDPISGTPSPGVTETVRHSAPGVLGMTDQSGRMPLPDPLKGLDAQAGKVLATLRKASAEAHARGRAAGHGWVSLRDLGVHKAVLDGLVAGGHIDQETRPGGAFSPETGTVYRIKGHE